MTKGPSPPHTHQVKEQSYLLANSDFIIPLRKQLKYKNSQKLGSFPQLTAICPFQSCPEALWRLVGKFNGHLKECNGELLMHLGGHPQAESIVYHLGFYNDVHELIHEIQSQMAVLQECPTSLRQQQ